MKNCHIKTSKFFSISIILTILFSIITMATPAEAVFLYGIGRPTWENDGNENPLNITSMMSNVSATTSNCFRIAMYNNSNPSASYFQTVKNHCDSNNISILIQTLGASVGAMTDQEEMNIINNVGTAQTDWIAAWNNTIEILDPYAITILNEPTNNGTYSTADTTTFANYRQFCINCIESWRAIKPDLVILVNNEPFNDQFDSTSYGFATNPLNYTDIIYGRHIYYGYDGTYPPEYLPEQQAYWNATNEADLIAAKALLENFIDTEMASMINIGQNVAYDEWGVNKANPNVANYTRDFINLCFEKNISTVLYALVPWSESGGGSTEQIGIVNNDYSTYNEVGEIWAESMYNITETLTTSTPTATTEPANNPSGSTSNIYTTTTPLPEITLQTNNIIPQNNALSIFTVATIIILITGAVVAIQLDKKQAKNKIKWPKY